MTEDPHYSPDCDLFLGIDKGFSNPNVTLWIQPDRKRERVIVLFAHYQVLRTPDENARIAWKSIRPRDTAGLAADGETLGPGYAPGLFPGLRGRGCRSSSVRGLGP